MTILQKFVVFSLSLLVVAGQAAYVDGQIINASSSTNEGGVQTAVGSSEMGEEKGGFLPVSWPSITLPKVTMPKVNMPKWPTNPDGSAVSPFAPISAGATKVSEGTKKAWEGAKEMFSFGGSSETTRRVAPTNSTAEPTFWQRMIGKQPEPEGPQTVAEFMSQPRVGH